MLNIKDLTMREMRELARARRAGGATSSLNIPVNLDAFGDPYDLRYLRIAARHAEPGANRGTPRRPLWDTARKLLTLLRMTSVFCPPRATRRRR